MTKTEVFFKLIPDVRGWAIVGFFGLAFKLLDMIGNNQALLKDASFMQFAQSLATGGVLLVATNLFGGTKSGAETNKALAGTLTPGSGSVGGQ